LLTDANVFAGTERHMLDLALGLRALGVGVTLACPRPSILSEKADAASLSVLPIAKGGLIDRPAVTRLRRALASGEIDLIHSHNGRSMLSAALAVRLSPRGLCVATQHFLRPHHTTQAGLKGILARNAHRWVGSQTARFIAISQAVMSDMVERGETRPNKTTVVPNGISEPDLGTAARPDAIRANLGVPRNALLIVCAARLVPEKDIPTLFNAIQTVLAARSDIFCVIAGEGFLWESLHKVLVEMHLIDRVKLLGFRPDVHAIMHAADIVVLPAPAEPFGLVLLEAMALRKPIVAVGVGGPLEIVVEGETGRLVPPGRSDLMAAALLELISSQPTREAMGRRGRARYEAEFTAERMAEATLDVYRDVLGR
jgi:glycosyltransferase involved in cell wall biosynthesis